MSLQHDATMSRCCGPSPSASCCPSWPLRARWSSSVVRAVGGALPGGSEIAGAVQPESVPPGPSTTTVIFYLPTDGEWLINIPGYGEIEGKDFDSFLRLQCRPLSIHFDGEGAWGWPGCASPS